jgi:hypothetical protein
MTTERRHHDMGGLPAGPVERSEHVFEPWENKTDAIVRLLGQPQRGPVMRIDELRRAIEEMGPGIYDELSYYERWIAGVTNILIEKGVLSVDEVGRRIEAVKARHPAPEAGGGAP